MNFVIIDGNLGTDATVHQTKNGKQFVSLRVANNERGITTWVNVTTWDEAVIKNSSWLKKGKKVTIVGRLRADKNGALFVSNAKVTLQFKGTSAENRTGYQNSHRGSYQRREAPAQTEELVEPVEDEFDEVPF